VKEEIPFDSMDKVHRHAGRTPDEILQFMKHQDMVVSSRYHGAVLSLMMHTISPSLNFSDKRVQYLSFTLLALESSLTTLSVNREICASALSYIRFSLYIATCFIANNMAATMSNARKMLPDFPTFLYIVFRGEVILAAALCA
jgi:hypothetical protein